MARIEHPSHNGLSELDLQEEYNASKDERTSKTQTIQTSDAGNLQRAVNKTEQRFGAPRYITNMLKAEDQIAKLMGLYAPAKTEVTGANGGPIQTEEKALDARRERVNSILDRLNERTSRTDEPARIAGDGEIRGE